MSAASRYNLAPIPSSLVFSIYADCIGLFDQIIAFQSSGLRGESIKKGLLKEAHDKVQEQLGRLRLWAAKVSSINTDL